MSQENCVRQAHSEKYNGQDAEGGSKIPVSAHPEMTNWPDIGVIRKILSSKYQPYVSEKIFRKP
jgi:hypothetical protein